jgi:hypothetical protein
MDSPRFGVNTSIGIRVNSSRYSANGCTVIWYSFGRYEILTVIGTRSPFETLNSHGSKHPFGLLGDIVTRGLSESSFVENIPFIGRIINPLSSESRNPKPRPIPEHDVQGATWL